MNALETFGKLASPKTIVPPSWLTTAPVRRRSGARRIAADEHWPTDVIVGDALGIASVAAAHVLLAAANRARDGKGT